MRKLSATAALATIAILLAPAVTYGQGTGSPSSVSPISPQVTSSPGTNSAGTAQSSGRLNIGEGVTTGAAAATEGVDKAIADENRTVDRRMKGICRGC
ncbi:hypothetical protein [Bradyrhizobium elkanii]|uniref:hypothetical protein n=1 Tax=Bradyrhizobium elkanii TaxID=29448 RepID=UPI000A5CF0F0|nr:hypothetical protein [Bradyrhizobium elkanii]